MIENWRTDMEKQHVLGVGNTWNIWKKPHLASEKKPMHIEMVIHKETSPIWFKGDNLQSRSCTSQFAYG